MIACPTCGAAMSVKETRGHHNYIRRRRVCDQSGCEGSAKTIELIVDDDRQMLEGTIVPLRDLQMIAKLIGGPLKAQIGAEAMTKLLLGESIEED